MFKFFGKKKKKETRQVSGVIYTGADSQIKNTPDRYDQYARETYMSNVIAYRCIDYRAKSFSSVPWNVLNSEKEKVEKHPFNKILSYPNIDEGWGFFSYKELAYRLIAGNSFTHGLTLNKNVNAETIKEMHILRPDKIKQICKEGSIVGYEYKIDMNNPIVYDRNPITGESELMHIMLFNPLDEIWGMGPTKPAARDIDSSNQATDWNLKMIQNEGRPGMVITVDGNLTDEQFDRMENQLSSMYSGAKNAGRTLILDGMKTEAKPYNWSPKEMDWLETNREKSRQICLAYSVPPLLISIPGDSTYNNYKEARLAFWEDTVLSDLSLYKSEINNWLFKNTDNFLNYDLDNVPAFSEKRDQLWARAETSTFLTTNEKRAIVGFDPDPNGNEILVPANLLPLGAAEIVTEADEKAQLKKLIDSGYTKEQAERMLGFNF